MTIDHHFYKFINVPAPVLSFAKQTFFTFGEDINKWFNSVAVPRT